jgi:hypothetical protein
MTRADNSNRNETMMTVTQQLTTAGTRVCTVGRDGAKMAGKFAQVYTGKIYEATPRKDGVLAWQLVGKFGGSRSGSGKPSAKFIAEIKAAAQHEWRDVRHGQVCD